MARKSAKMESVQFLRFSWITRRRGLPVMFRSLEEQRLNRRFERRFREIWKRMGPKAKGNQVLDARSKILYLRCQEEWDAVQPRSGSLY